MSDIDKADVVHTRIWHEEAEAGNPFATKTAYCRGYDVYGQLVGRARWVEMLLLQFCDELPAADRCDMLEALAVALANPGPRDPSVHAAMCGGVGGSLGAASLIAALSVGAGRSGGARDVYDAIGMWQECGMDIDAWVAAAGPRASDPIDAWPDREHTPGFNPNTTATMNTVRHALDVCADVGATPCVNWLNDHLEALCERIGHGLAMSGVAAAVCHDLGLAPEVGEMLFLMLRLPGAAAHALEQRAEGYRRFPFYQIELEAA